jgi:glycosyltransferase involved in cell wall biosynthesis
LVAGLRVASVEGPVEIIVNARFRRQPITGVQRYAQEVTARLRDRLRFIEPGFVGRGMMGHLWEQAILPRRLVANALLWSPTNTGPLAVTNQVVTIHDLSVLDHPEWFSPRFATWYRFLLPRLAHRVKHVLTDSEYSKTRIVTLLAVPEERVSVVPLGVSPGFRPAEEAGDQKPGPLPGLPQDYLVVVGSLEPRKNLARVFEAWERVRASYPDVTLLVLGGAARVFRGRGFVEAPKGVLLAGYVADDDLPRLYGGAVGFVYASLYEGFGLPVLEAMACGTPVVCANTTSLPEVAGNAALLVDPYDIDDIAQGMGRLLGDRELRDRLRAEGLARARQFNWDVTAERTWDILVRQAEVNP